jgi:hypothetical protein
MAWLDRRLLLVLSRRPFLLVFRRGLRLVFDLFSRHHVRRIMCGDGHGGTRIRARDERHARAFFLEIVTYDNARLLIAPKPLIGRQVETARTACEAHKDVNQRRHVLISAAEIAEAPIPRLFVATTAQLWSRPCGSRREGAFCPRKSLATGALGFQGRDKPCQWWIAPFFARTGRDAGHLLRTAAPAHVHYYATRSLPPSLPMTFGLSSGDSRVCLVHPR